MNQSVYVFFVLLLNTLDLSSVHFPCKDCNARDVVILCVRLVVCEGPAGGQHGGLLDPG